MTDFQQTFQIIRQRLWLILLLTFLAGSIAFVVVVSQPSRYRSQVTLAIGGYIQAPNPELQEIRTGLDLSQTYVYLVRTRNVLQRVIDDLDLDLEPDDLDQLLDTRIIPGTSLLQIGVTTDDPLLARDIADEIAANLVRQSPTNLTPEQQEQISLLSLQINVLTDELAALREELQQVEIALDDETLAAADRSRLGDQRRFLIGQVNEFSGNIAQFTGTIASLQQRTNSVEIIERAIIPEDPVGPGTLILVGLVSILAALLVTGTIFLYDYLNDTIQTTDDVVNNLQLPVMGLISSFGKSGDEHTGRLITSLPVFSRVVQEYSTLRTNLYFSTPEDARVFVVSSASPREGKSLTAANLAISLALAGHRVLLIDADLRRPAIHTAFGLPGDTGLSTLLQRPLTDADQKTADSPELLEDDRLQSFIQSTDIPGLMILPAGLSPRNPAELLGFSVMRHWMARFRQSPDLDIVICDTPPVLAVPDAAVLAAISDASVLLVLHASTIRRNSALQARQRFEQVNVNIAGVVLNQVQDNTGIHRTYSYSDYYTDAP